MRFNLFHKKQGPTFTVIRPHTAECLPDGYFWVEAGDRKTLGFKCVSFFSYEVRTPVNDGKAIIHLADFLKANGMKSAEELPTVVLTLQKADRTQHNIEGTNVIETEALDDFSGEVAYDGVPNSGVQWQ